MFSLFGLFGNSKIKNALKEGVTIVDVRTVHEYDQGRLPGSINIPIERVSSSLDRIKHLKEPIIFCSNGDGRSGNAARYARRNGVSPVYDGGNWEKILRISKSL